jgi:hypothetical protein
MSRPALNILWLLVIPLSAMWSDIVSRYLQSSYNDFSSVADPECLSRIPDPDFYQSWIPDLGSKNSYKREE